MTTTELPITPRENWLRFLRHEKPVWMPLFTDCQLIMPACVPDNKARAMVVEAEPIPEEQGGGRDMFGVNWVYVPTVHGSMEDPDEPHMLDDISEWREKIKFPDMDSWDWEGAAKRNEGFCNPDKFRVTWFFTGMFERLISFMGFEDAAMTLIDEDCEEDLHALFDALADNAIDLLGRMKKYFGIDGVYYHDDWGAQRSPFFSMHVVQNVIGPHIKKIIDFCHENDIYFELHSCGMIEDLTPAMIEIGVDCWCGQDVNDKLKLYDLYADKIAIGFWAMPGADEADCRKLVDDVVEHIAPTCDHKFMYMMDVASAMPGSGLKQYVLEKTMPLYA